MRAVAQRVRRGAVQAEGRTCGQIDRGLLVFLGVKRGDSTKDADYITEKVVNLRIFPDAEGKMNLSLLDIQGEILLVSQFTLYGDVRKGRRPSFTEAEWPQEAQPLVEYCRQAMADKGLKVETGIFGADMLINIENEGPVTILLDSERRF